MTRNEPLHAKLDKQIEEYRAEMGEDPRTLDLTCSEIDEWRNQFNTVIPVASLAYKDIPIQCSGCMKGSV